MILCAHADAGFLNKSNSRSRAGAHIFVLENDPFPRFNGAILSIALALANAPATPPSYPFVRMDGLIEDGVVGAMMLFYLIWLVHGGFLVKK